MAKANIKKLRTALGVKETPKEKAKAVSQAKQRKRIEVLDFAHEHGMVIHPGAGYDYYIDSYFTFNYCPCDKTRPNCPCPESIEEVKKIGWCQCRLFWRDLVTYKVNHIGG